MYFRVHYLHICQVITMINEKDISFTLSKPFILLPQILQASLQSLTVSISYCDLRLLSLSPLSANTSLSKGLSAAERTIQHWLEAAYKGPISTWIARQRESSEFWSFWHEFSTTPPSLLQFNKQFLPFWVPTWFGWIPEDLFILAFKALACLVLPLRLYLSWS